jgi:hypothetical protein
MAAATPTTAATTVADETLSDLTTDLPLGPDPNRRFFAVFLSEETRMV